MYTTCRIDVHFTGKLSDHTVEGIFKLYLMSVTLALYQSSVPVVISRMVHKRTNSKRDLTGGASLENASLSPGFRALSCRERHRTG